MSPLPHIVCVGCSAFGRRESWEDSPEGWPQNPTMGWLRRHDEDAEAVR
jgi:hypothetical protein